MATNRPVKKRLLYFFLGEDANKITNYIKHFEKFSGHLGWKTINNETNLDNVIKMSFLKKENVLICIPNLSDEKINSILAQDINNIYTKTLVSINSDRVFSMEEQFNETRKLKL